MKESLCDSEENLVENSGFAKSEISVNKVNYTNDL
jgi:hypothetical protein